METIAVEPAAVSRLVWELGEAFLGPPVAEPVSVAATQAEVVVGAVRPLGDRLTGSAREAGRAEREVRAGAEEALERVAEHEDAVADGLAGLELEAGAP